MGLSEDSPTNPPKLIFGLSPFSLNSRNTQKILGDFNCCFLNKEPFWILKPHILIGDVVRLQEEKRSLNKTIIFLLVFLFLSLALNNSTLAADLPPVKGRSLPAINLPIPQDLNGKRYLGLSGNGNFKIPQIRAQAVVVSIFSLYCPTCQSTASAMTALYHRIENDPDLKGRMKLIGIAAGNSPYEVEVLKETYKIPFPVFPDKDYTIHKALGEVRTPYFIAAKINRDGSEEVVYTQLGGFIETEPFLEVILVACGLEQKKVPLKKEDLAISLVD